MQPRNDKLLLLLALRHTLQLAITTSPLADGRSNGRTHKLTTRSVVRMSWIHNVLKWSGKTYEELKALAQDRKKWRRLSWEFSSAAKLL